MWFGKYRSGNREFVPCILDGLFKRKAAFTAALPAVSGLKFHLKTCSGSFHITSLHIFLLNNTTISSGLGIRGISIWNSTATRPSTLVLCHIFLLKSLGQIILIFKIFHDLKEVFCLWFIYIYVFILYIYVFIFIHFYNE